MILDRKWNNKKSTLTISYIDKNGHRKYYEKTMAQFPTYEFDVAGKYKNWDGKFCKSILKSTDTYKPSEFDILEYMYKSELIDEFSAVRYPKLYTFDIETEVSDVFPDPDIADQTVTAISCASEDLSVIVLGLKPLNNDQLDKFKNSYISYIKENEFASKVCDLSKVRVLYQYFTTEEAMLRHFFEIMIPKMEVLSGWNCYGFDWRYLTKRMENLFGEKEAMSILFRSSDKNEIRRVSYMDNSERKFFLNMPAHTSILDYMELVKKYDYTIDIKESLSLDWISHAAIGANKIKYDGTLQQLYEQDFDKYVFYNAVDSLLVQLIHKRLKTMEVLFVYSAFTLVPLSDCVSPVKLTTALLFENFYKNGQHVVWEKKENGGKVDFEGGYCKAPVVGYHEWLVCDDFASLYPSQIQTCNISVENLIVPKSESGYSRVWTQEELDKFKKDPNYFVTVLGHVYKNDQYYCFKRMQKETKQKRDFFKYRGQKLESELLHEIEKLISEK
jgi:DNA polymerase elongation subunit (family B)